MGAAMADLKLAAYKLAKSGVAVFPVRDKQPIVEGGFHSATTDKKVIGGWPWDEANGIAAAIPEGTFVVDIDKQHNGFSTIETLKDAGLSFPATRVHGTQSGGIHRFYKIPDGHPDDVRLKGKLGPGVDIKVSGKGYIVYPPTYGYSVNSDTDIADAPDWMMDELVKPVVENEPSMGGLPKFFDLWQDGTDYGIAAMKSEIQQLEETPVGERNNALNKASFALAQLVAGGELAEDPARAALTAEGDRLSTKPDEVQQTITSGWEAGLQEPREATPLEAEEAPAVVGDIDDFGPDEAEHEEMFWLDWENADDTPPPFYCHPLVPKNAYIIVYGATEASKSMVMMGLAVEGSHKGLKTSIYSLENPSHIDIDRVRRLGPEPKNFRISNQMLDINEARQVHAMVEREKAWGTDVVIIDTYSHAFNSRSEDGNHKAIEFARRIRYIMRKVGCTVIVVDHTGYADHGEPRDASAKRQQVDVAIKMDKPEGMEWKPGQPSHFEMSVTKAARFGNPGYLRGKIVDGENRKLSIEWMPTGKGPEWRME